MRSGDIKVISGLTDRRTDEQTQGSTDAHRDIQPRADRLAT